MYSASLNYNSLKLIHKWSIDIVWWMTLNQYINYTVISIKDIKKSIFTNQYIYLKKDKLYREIIYLN